MGAFDQLRFPTSRIWFSIKQMYPFGAAWPHAVPNLLAAVVITLNDAIYDCLDLRNAPSLALLTPRNDKNARVLTISISNSRMNKKKRFEIKVGAKTITIDGNPIYVADEHGPHQLVNAIIDDVEKFYEAN